MRSFGNQRTMAFRPAVSAAATPKPISARASTRVANPSDMANSAAPAAAMSARFWKACSAAALPRGSRWLGLLINRGCCRVIWVGIRHWGPERDAVRNLTGEETGIGGAEPIQRLAHQRGAQVHAPADLGG